MEVGMTPIWVALIAMFSTSLSSPLLVAWWQQRSLAKAALLAHQDTERVAAKAREAAELLIESNHDIAKQARIASVKTVTKLDAIHTLVNSNMTAAMERELSATRAMLVSMREVISLKDDRGIPISDETREIISEVERRISEMVADLRYKKQQTALAEAELRRRGQTSSPVDDPKSPEFGREDPYAPSTILKLEEFDIEDPGDGRVR